MIALSLRFVKCGWIFFSPYWQPTFLFSPYDGAKKKRVRGKRYWEDWIGTRGERAEEERECEKQERKHVFVREFLYGIIATCFLSKKIATCVLNLLI